MTDNPRPITHLFASLELAAKESGVAAWRRLLAAREHVTVGRSGAVLAFGDRATEYFEAAETVAAYTAFEPRRDFGACEEWHDPRREPPETSAR